MMKMTIAMLIVAQQQVAPLPQVRDTIYETPGLAELVDRAARLNAQVPAGLESYRARVETELSLVRAEPDGRETLLQLEQVASDLFWRSDGGMLQRLVGYRSQTLGPSFSGLSFFDVPWVVPILYGERIDLVRTGGPIYAEGGAMLRRRAIHPLGALREDVYRFTGGDTVDIIVLPARRIPIVRIHIVRMQGRLVPSGRGRTLLDAVVQGVLFVQFETAEYDEGYWLPRTQRFESQAISRLGEERILFRAVSRFVDIHTNDPDAVRLAADPVDFPYGRMEGDDDLGALGRFGDWRIGLGDLSAEVDARDFDAYAPPGFARTGEPRLSFGARRFSHLFRINTVEGAFTGGGLVFEPGDAVPGLAMRVHGGWAWGEGVARGGAEVSQRAGPWEFITRAERQLAHTNDFTWGLDPEPGVPPLLGADQYDFLDRRIASVIARTTRGEGVAWRFEAGRASDRNVGRHALDLDDYPWDPADPDRVRPPTHIGNTRLNRPIFPGNYWLGRAELRHAPSAGGISLHPGLALRLAWEGATGDLDWQRVEAGTALRRVVGRWTLGLRGDAGMAFSPEMPPQAIFELGTTNDLPGFAHKAFVGDRAAIGRASIAYTLPVFNAPIRLGSLWLPALAPAPAVGVQVGWTDASAETLQLMDRFGWSTSDGARAALDLRLRFFGGGLSIGAARPLDRDGEWRFVWSLGGGL
jgi:hypothetical protein